MPTPEPILRPGGWGWLTGSCLPRSENVRTKIESMWDGLFTATCPCGRDTFWDAFSFQPICICPQVAA